MTLEDYLLTKKIDAALFRSGEPARWAEFNASFAGVHPDSFTAQKKFLLNDLRRRYRLQVPEAKSLARPAEKPSDQPAPTVPAVPAETKLARPVVKRPAAVVRKPPETN